MTVNAGVAFGMMHVDGVAEAAYAHRYARDVSVADGKDGPSLPTARLHVDAAVKVVGARFAEVAGQGDRLIHGRAEGHFCCQ